ncbi:platelet endothelial aggregation receptor 1-like isoform X2 [Maniola jurtina]|uniref:platelet endothelial aggregation receptor 1-like isoform X2 n=1 Tax=Maniola jurtina TaxID=191418 RepID=UPI001E68EE44|nr:platelet endothelial aggregation receptor 1-like isoform X2 [Maniola jurtina]
MMLIVIGALLLGCACADDAQWINVKSGVKGGVKGGHQGWSGYPYYNPSAPGNTQEGGYGGYVMRFNMTRQQNGSQQATGGYGKDFREVGVCYIEVPTASLARDPAHVPTGNGSRPDLSRIRTCCKGYERNIELFQVCDPVCNPECVNAVCTSPNVCTCYPDHIRNLGGFCMPTCPIGCQNGRCSGGECLCKDGYTLDTEGKFCKPVCRENCGGIGNCTEPNICTCKTGYQATPEGNCKAMCSDQCRNGDCVGPNECRCKPGYRKSQGQCEPECPQCPNGRCIGPNVCSNQPNPSSTTQPQGSVPPYYPPYQQNNRLYPDSQVQNGTAPGQAYPGQGYPGQTYPGQGYPVQTNPGQGYPGQAYPGQAYPGLRYPGQTNPDQRYPGQSYPGQTNPDQQGNRNPQNHLYPESHGLSGFGQSGQSGIQSQTGYQNQSGYHRETGYQGQTEYQGQSGTYGQSGQQGSTGQAGYYGQRPQYPGQPDSQNQFGYPGMGYPGGRQPSPANPDGQYECLTQCVNGVCVEGNMCRCNPGYVLDPSDSSGSRCIPYCPGGCPNGTCSAPNFCICNAGYRKDTSVKGRPACVKRIRRSAEEQKPEDIAKLLIFEIPEY